MQPEPEMRAYLQRISGYSMTGEIRDQAFFLHHGLGANGKSVWSDTIGVIMGDYGMAVSPSVLLASSQEQHPTGLAAMAGKRWLPATETAPGKRLDEEKIKNITGDRKVTARFIAKDFFEFEPTGKIHLITNHTPRLSDARSIWRRIHLIKWGVILEQSEQDTELQAKLERELSGILAWMVRGAQEWYRTGLMMPDAAALDLAEYQERSDTFGDFLREYTMPAPNARTPVASLYRSYETYCFASGTKAMTMPSFTETLSERGYKRFSDGKARGFLGIVPSSPDAVPSIPAFGGSFAWS
jgi:putative DNA primase/helicase